jgi:hypothetical protein
VTKKLSDAERYQKEQDLFFADLEAAATENAARTQLAKLSKAGLTSIKLKWIRPYVR